MLLVRSRDNHTLLRRPTKLTVALVYVPYVISTGRGMLGDLPGCLTGEGYATGRRFALLALVSRRR